MRRRDLIIALGFATARPIAANGQPDVRALRSQILLMQAEGIADKLAEFIEEVRTKSAGPRSCHRRQVPSISVSSTRCGFCTRFLLLPSCR